MTQSTRVGGARPSRARWRDIACRQAALLLALAISASAATAQTASRHLAPGFTELAKGAKVVMMPIDVQLFSLSAGGVPEAKADWTRSAKAHMRTALAAMSNRVGLDTVEMPEEGADELAEQIGLHAAVARSIALHHATSTEWALPTKEGRLDWTFGDAMQPVAARSGADYGLFIWVHDSYASGERKAAMVALAILSMGNIVLGGGVQTGYASLVELKTGRVLWFNRLFSGSGDLRETEPAIRTVETLMTGFPAVK